MHPFYDKITNRARKSLELANDFAFKRKSVLVTNSHILWGICEEGNNIASQILKNLKVRLKHLQEQIEKEVGIGKYSSHASGVPYAEDARNAICKAIDLGRPVNHIGCQHFLLAILMDKESHAGRLLDKLDVTYELALTEIIRIVKPLD